MMQQRQQRNKRRRDSKSPRTGGKGRKPSQPMKKTGMFNLKANAVETIDIPTSTKIFRPQSKPRPRDGQKSYGVIFFETFSEAESQMQMIEEAAAACEQLNVVIHQEGAMLGTPFNAFGKVFAGEAWWTIHKRREAEGWYKDPH